MLVLTRKRDEGIKIGDNIQVVVLSIRGDKVRLGISAPTDIPVHRKEVYNAIRRAEEQRTAEQRAAAPPAPIPARRPKRARRDDGRSGVSRSGG